MRNISLTVLLSIITLGAGAQENHHPDGLKRSSIANDTVIVEDVDTGERRKVRILVPGDDEGVIRVTKSEDSHRLRADEEQSDDRKTRTSRPIYGVTLSRIDLGLVKLVDNGSFTLSDNNRDLRYRPGKTVNFGFDLLQAGYRFNDHFRIFLSGGFDWTYIRLRENIDFRENTTPLTWDVVSRDEINYNKNKLTATYLRLPLTFEWRSQHNSSLGRLKFAAGPEAGFLLKGTQRFKSAELGKQKFKDDYNLAQFRYGAFARFGVGAFGIYAKYYFNDMFENSPDQAGLRNFTFGLMLGF